MADAAASPSRAALAARIAKYAYQSTESSPADRPSRITASKARNAASGRTPRASRNARDDEGSDEDYEESDGDASDEDALESQRAPRRQGGRGITPKRVPSGSQSSTPSKRRRVASGNTASPSPAKKGKAPRGYAAPEVYAHLKNTPDHLVQGLNIIFCGINPGKQSAATGTHFAHPTNKFWASRPRLTKDSELRSLHQSDLTSRLYAAAECHLLPEEQGYGLTNLCGRPTAEQAELSPLEMRLNVHPFTLKIAHYRPRVVCFVGKKIWDVYASVCGKTATQSAASIPSADAGALDPGGVFVPVKAELWNDASAANARPAVVDEIGEVPRPVVPIKTELAEPLRLAPRLQMDDEPPDAFEVDVKLDVDRLESIGPAGATSGLNSPPVRDTPPSSTARPGVEDTRVVPGRERSKAPMDWHSPRPLRLPLPMQPGSKEQEYTYFWVTPSTSGLERTPLVDLVAIFASLRSFAERLQARYQPPASAFRDIDVEGLAQTSANIRAAAIAQGKVVLDSVHKLTYG